MKRNILIGGAAETGEAGPFQTGQGPAEDTLSLSPPAKPTQVITRMILRLPSAPALPGEGAVASESPAAEPLKVDTGC